MPIRSQFKSKKEWLKHLHLWFAGQVLAGSIPPEYADNFDSLVTFAYQCADAMISRIEN